MNQDVHSKNMLFSIVIALKKVKFLCLQKYVAHIRTPVSEITADENGKKLQLY